MHQNKYRLIPLFLISFLLFSVCGPSASTPTAPPATDEAQPSDTPTSVVEQPPTEDVPPLPTNTPTQPPSPTQPPPVATPTEDDCTPDSEFVNDITIPDGTLINPGETFVKTWRIRNDGDCTWNSSYQFAQISGQVLTAAQSIPLPDVAPGSVVDISVTLTLAPDAWPGSRQISRFQIRTAGGRFFGTRPFALITVASSQASCLNSTGNLVAFINASDRFCLLHPSDFTANITAIGTYITGPVPPGEVEPIVVYLEITNEGSVNQTTQQFADQKISEWQAPGNPPDTGTVIIGGNAGVWAEGLPGIMGTRISFVVVNNKGYIFTLFPVDGSVPTETAAAEAFWQVILDSIIFLIP
ncbi:MAG: hypothetical protein FVQ83_16485 [Chloroflexi bacterium]|nr:hypothetical protein [Chloroflexota bacterium]